MKKSIFLDSGAHSIYELIMKKQGKGYEYVETDEFWKYVDAYALFIKEHQHLLDVYVSVDIIFRPDLSWRVQKYMEDMHKLKPLPVYHHGEDFKWLKLYIDNYDYVGIGGLGQDVTKSAWMQATGDPAFDLMCDAKGMPRVKAHGFAMTSPDIVMSYPWYSIDSTSWVLYGKYGIVLVPKVRNGSRDFGSPPIAVKVSSRSPSLKEREQHLENLSPMNRKRLIEYFAERGFKLGVSEFKTVGEQYTLKENETWADRKERLVEVISEKGLANDHKLRDIFNRLYFHELERSVPDWPWPWKRTNKQRGLEFDDET